MDKYTREDWQRDQSFKAVPGQEIEKEIYEDMFNVLPPLRLPRNKVMEALETMNLHISAGFMMGEPHSHSKNGALFMAFGKTYPDESGERYYYLGLG